MDMNIGSLMRALIRDSQPSDVKALELRVGQIVRGVLVEMLDGQEGLININGVLVRARLEAELRIGQGTLLQVQAESASGLVSLKPLGDAAAAASLDEALLRDGAKAFGLPEQAWSRELLRGLARDGYPVSRETADWFKAAAAAMPQGADAREWMDAAGVAFRRGLQPTETTVASLREALYGRPLHEQLSTLASLVGQTAADASAAPGLSAAARRTERLLGAIVGLIGAAAGEDMATDGQVVREPSGRAAGAQAAAQNGAAQGQEQAEEAPDAVAGRMPGPGGGQGAAVPGPAGGPGAGQSGSAAAANAQGTRAGSPGGQAADAAEAGMAPAGAEAAGRLGRDAAAAAGGGLRAGASADLQARARSESESRQVADDGTRPAHAAPRGEPAGTARAGRAADEPWLGKLLTALGAGHERAAMQGGLWSDPQQGDAGAAHGQAADAGRQQADTLKAALLGLSRMEDAPPALREAAQTLVQQITGQQLLLSAERQNTAMMSHMTLFIPMKNKDGETTAKVHVEARRSQRGEWDADNCRLLFDLELQHMGHTVVDVQVVDRSVSLRLLNDRPEVAEWIQGARAEAASGLQSAGYRLMSLTAAPYPERSQGESAGSGGAKATGAYAARPYKGIDYKA